MKSFLVGLFVALACTRCGAGLSKVTFEYFNLGQNEIWVTGVAGLPPDATPGRLMPSHDENPLEVKASVLSETVHIKDHLMILWKDNGPEGWPGGLKIPGSIPPGTAHQVELKRDDLGIPAKLSSGRIRFTYLGNEKWRVKLYK